jgi:hypothetical protein
MSGIEPYVYIALGDEGLIQAAGPDSLIYAFDGETVIFIDAGNTEMFNPGCLNGFIKPTYPIADHPVGSYNTDYPYCRTTIKYRVDDKRSNPQIAQLISTAPFFIIRLELTGCDKSNIRSVVSRLEPQQSEGCGAELYTGFTPLELYLLLTMATLSLPARITFTITLATGIKKEFWVGIRDSRNGVPSGAVI